MTIEELNQLLATEDSSAAINELKNGRTTSTPEAEHYLKELNPATHDVMDAAKRKDKWVKVDVSDETDVTEEDETKTKKVVTGKNGEQQHLRIERVARVALAIQKLIVKRAVAFTFGNPVTLNAEPEEGTKESEVLKAVQRVLFETKSRTINRKIARSIFSGTEAAELWYPVEVPTTKYGFKSKFKLRVAVFSPLNGDLLYPYFDETGDMLAFSREYVIKDNKGRTTTYFETYTDTDIRKWEASSRVGRRSEPYRPLGKTTFQLRRYQRLPRKPEDSNKGRNIGLGEEGRSRSRYRNGRKRKRGILVLGAGTGKRKA